jgi:general secretion pathway protein F
LSGTSPFRTDGVSLAQLIALNEELAALVRAGIPLESGLVELGRDIPGRVGELATLLGMRMSRGENLPEILASEPQLFPPVWRAVVLAGIRSGQLAAALEGMATTGRRIAELRRATAAALMYPLIVVGLAYVLFVAIVRHFAPVVLAAMEDLTSRSNAFLAALVWLGQRAIWWAPWLPVACLLLLALWWFRWGRAGRLFREVIATGPQRRRAWSRATLRQTLYDSRLATFAELLALLVEQQVPVHEAVVLAADATGDRGLSQAAREAADRLQRGELSGDRQQIAGRFPPLLAWLIATRPGRVGFGRTLRMAAETYRRRAQRAVAWRTAYLPIVLTAVIGGGFALLQALVVFFPYSRLLYELGMPH